MYIKSLHRVTFKTYITVVILILIDVFHLLYKTVDKLCFHKTQPRCVLHSTSQLPGNPLFFPFFFLRNPAPRMTHLKSPPDPGRVVDLDLAVVWRPGHPVHQSGARLGRARSTFGVMVCV